MMKILWNVYVEILAILCGIQEKLEEMVHEQGEEKAREFATSLPQDEQVGFMEIVSDAFAPAVEPVAEEASVSGAAPATAEATPAEAATATEEAPAPEATTPAAETPVASEADVSSGLEALTGIPPEEEKAPATAETAQIKAASEGDGVARTEPVLDEPAAMPAGPEAGTATPA